MKQLYLIGTIHTDKKGPKRLERMLSAINPKSIAVEYSQQRLEADRKLKPILNLDRERVITYFKKNGGIKRAEAIRYLHYIALSGYEYEISKAHTLTHNTGIDMVDYTEGIFQPIEVRSGTTLLTTENETLNKSYDENLREFITTPVKDFQKMMDAEYNSKSEDDAEFIRLFGEQFLERRDEKIEEKIRMLSEQTSGNLVYVGGMLHSFDKYLNLYDRLIDLNPVRISLISADDRKFMRTLERDATK